MRRALGFAVVLATAMLLLTGFIYWQTVGYLRGQIDGNLRADARTLAAESLADLPARLTHAIDADARRLRVGGVFDADGRRLAGNLRALPEIRPAPGRVGPLGGTGDAIAHGDGAVRAAVEPLTDGRLLVFGRRVDELGEIDEIVSRALALTALPIVALAVLGGLLLGRTSLRRVEAVERTCRRIMAGHLDERLPVDDGNDAFDALAATVNRMLEEIERLMVEVKGAGDAVAHDLRTPLTRLRARLDRLAATDADPAQLRVALERTVADVDQLLAMARAILRIGEIEGGQRRAGFGPVTLTDIVMEVGDFYGAIAEERNVAFSVSADPVPPVYGDGELLFEAVGNLVDNAIKFTPAGGRVELSLSSEIQGAVVRVCDSGPGIAPGEREAVLRRFHRAEPSRRIPGTGLGLAIVAAIARLHGFSLALDAGHDEQGCVASLTARYQ